MKQGEMSISDYIVLLIALLFMVIGIMSTVSFFADLLKDKAVNQSVTEQSGETVYSINDFDVFIDKQAGVVCWHQENISAGTHSISCLPISETKLDDNEPKQP